MATYNITLKAWSDNAVLEPLTIYQNDVLSRTINITLMDNNGPPIDLTDSAVRVYFVKSDKKIVYQEADIVDQKNGKISVICESQVTAVPGPVVAMVQAIYNNGSTLNIGPLRLIVTENNLDNAIISTNDFSALTAALLKADNIKNKVDAVILEGNQLSYIAGGEFEDEKIVDMLEQTKNAVIESDEFKSKADKTEVIPLSQKDAPNGVATTDSDGNLVQGLPMATITMDIGHQNQNKRTITFNKIGKMVFLSSQGWVDMGTLPASDTRLGSIPTSLLPLTDVAVPIADSNWQGYITFRTNGLITASSKANLAGWFHGTAYIAVN